MYTLYDYLPSGNGYKVRLTLTHLAQPFEYIEVDILSGDTRSSDFLRKNPNGKIPTLEYSPGKYLSESNAIMYYLADGSNLLPTDRLRRAQVMQWLFFEQYSHEPYIAVSRFLLSHGTPSEKDLKTVKQKKEGGIKALKVMEQHLKNRKFFVSDRYSIADIGLYAYTHVANEGGFDLGQYPSIQKWLNRIAIQPRHCRITDRW